MRRGVSVRIGYNDGEEVLAFSSGLMDESTWLITLTNTRIIFLDKGMIYGLNKPL